MKLDFTIPPARCRNRIYYASEIDSSTVFLDTEREGISTALPQTRVHQPLEYPEASAIDVQKQRMARYCCPF